MIHQVVPSRVLSSVLALVAAACGGSLPPETPPVATSEVEVTPVIEAQTAPTGAPDAAAPVDAGALVVPETLPESLVPRRKVAAGLANPRGMLSTDSGVLVALAGTGDPANPKTGALVRLTDRNADGDYLDKGEIRQLVGRQPSKNILEIVRRDEVFGMAAVASGGGETVATLAFFGGPSTVFGVRGDAVEPIGTVAGNLNDIVFHPKLGAWFAVSSSSDEVLRVDAASSKGDRVVKIPPLGGGQDSVPGYLDVEPSSGHLLVSLFSGSTAGEAGGEGTELQARAGAIVSVDPETGETTPFITGLTVPTDLLVTQKRVYVLEFCDAFLEPIGARAGLRGEPRHGGFRRFSGRLLAVDLESRTVTVVAKGLDGPTNLARVGTSVYVAQGMGTPGRMIPGPDGPTPLDGFVEAIELP